MVIGRGAVLGPDGLVEKDTKAHSSRRIALDTATTDLLRADRQNAEEAA